LGSMSLAITICLYCLAGAVAGLIAGLFGIGGGVVVVPMLVYVFSIADFPYELTMHLALATSMASIVFTSISSCYAHHRKGAVDWHVVKWITPGIVSGTFAGSFLVSISTTFHLKIFFVCFLYFVASQILFKNFERKKNVFPGVIGMSTVGSMIGLLSSFVGIGGGTMSVPFMRRCNSPLHKAIGTSAAIGLPIALSGAAGYVVYGLGNENLPQYSLGFVYLPALMWIIATSVLTAPFGVCLAHHLPVQRLKRLFALLLYCVATRMLWNLFMAN